MKRRIWLLCTLLLSFTSQAAPSFQYQLSIKNNVYDLVVQEVIPNTFANAVANLRNGQLYTAFDSSITGMERSNETEKDYQLTQTVTQLMVKTVSEFNCSENWGEMTWARACILLTNVKDGGKYMAWKKEVSSCYYNEGAEETHCTLRYQGQMKDIKAFGVTLKKSQSFAVKAKVQAINHFAKIWLYSQADGSSTDQVNLAFQQSPIATKLDSLLKVGTKQAEKEGVNFNFSDQYQ